MWAGFTSNYYNNKRLKINTRNYLLLDPTMPEKETKNARWRLIINLNEKGLEELE